MFKLKLYDRKGVELKLGDIVKVSNGKQFDFYAEVKYLEKEKVITPFHTFCFHSFEKIEKIPENAFKCKEDRYDIWAVCDDAEVDSLSEKYEKYLMDWRVCETMLEKRTWRIELEKNNND